MPQTREHLEICELLEVRQGIVVLTKIDMVDDEWLELVKEDVAGYLSGTFLADVPMVEVSSVTGEGLNDLIKILDELVNEIPARDSGHFFRLPVDRVFTMKGFGTVITGTTVSGKIRVGDETTIYPQCINARIRGIQVHNNDVDEVQAGLRTAINLQGLEKAMIQRGNVVADKDSLRSTYMIDVYFKLLSSAARKLKNRAKVRFHSGTTEIISTVVLLDRDELEKGDACFAQLRLDEPTALLRGDRYVLRSYSPVRTIGGGSVLNALPTKKKRFSQAVLSSMKSLHEGNLDEIIELFISLGRFQGVEQKELQFLINLSEKKLDAALQVLKAQNRVIQYDKEGRVIIHADFLKKAEDEIVEIIIKYHKDNPLKAGFLKEELRSRIKGARNPKLFNYIINRLVKGGIIVLEKELVRLKGHQVILAQDQKKVRQTLENIYGKAGLKPPYFKELKADFSGNVEEVLEVMVKEGVLLKIKEDLYFHRKAVEDLKGRLVDFLKKNGEITTPNLKEITGVSRKYTIPLIEYFDQTHLTVRVGDSRVLRKK